ncbi:MAG TPA: hypothetical protein PKH26_02715 [Phycisphaerae bacterium]|nr:hypothetical protein [Phycisphaerae bacterium]
MGARSEDNAASVELPPISTCACCGYSLAGSHEQLRCPERGAPFSLEDCTVIVANPLRRLRLYRAIAVFVVVAAGVYFHVLPGRAVAPIASVVVLVALFMSLYYRYWWACTVAFRTDGVTGIRAGRIVDVCPWSEIKGVRLRGSSKRQWGLVLFRTGSPWLHVVPCGLDALVAERLYAQIEQLRRHATEVEPATQHSERKQGSGEPPR